MTVDLATVSVERQRAGLDPERMPDHVAMIMDGNGRWARRQGKQRTRGHRQGAETVRTVCTESVKLGIRRLTLFAFSSENWSRPRQEISYLMRLLRQFLQREVGTLMENGVRLQVIGHRERLPDDVRRALDEISATSADNTNMDLCMALSYGGRDEIVDACRALATRVAAGELDPDTIDQKVFAAALYAPEAPDVDLLIRTAGEQRLSNFLTWQSVYAEFVFLPMLWPDLDVEAFHAALREYQGRDRRFGAVKAGAD